MPTISYDPQVQITVDGRRLGGEFSMQLVGGSTHEVRTIDSAALDRLGSLYGAPRHQILRSDRPWDTQETDEEYRERLLDLLTPRNWHSGPIDLPLTFERGDYRALQQALTETIVREWDREQYRPMPSVWDHILEAS